MVCPSGLEPESSKPCGYRSSPTLWSPGETDWSSHRPGAYPAGPAHTLCRPAGEEKMSQTICTHTPDSFSKTCNGFRQLVAEILGRNVIITMYPRFGIYSYNSCDRSHAISLWNEAKTGDDSGFGQGRHLSWSQLLHLTLREVTSKSQKLFSF